MIERNIPAAASGKRLEHWNCERFDGGKISGDSGDAHGVDRVCFNAGGIEKADVYRASRKWRGGGRRIELTDAIAVFEERAIDLLGLDAALTELATLDERKAKLVEIRFFGGLSVEEAAAAMGITLRTAERDWSFARAWLRTRLAGAGPA